MRRLLAGGRTGGCAIDWDGRDDLGAPAGPGLGAHAASRVTRPPGCHSLPLVTASTILQAIATATFVAGAIFTMVQLQHGRRAREREVALEILRLLQTPHFAKALRLMYDLEPGLSRAEVEARLGEDMNFVYSMMITWESLGVLVFRRQLDLQLVDDFVSGSLLLSWRKLERYVKEERVARGRETLLEWFQWLAERMIERESRTPVVPAHRAHADWRP